MSVGTLFCVLYLILKKNTLKQDLNASEKGRVHGVIGSFMD